MVMKLLDKLQETFDSLQLGWHIGLKSLKDVPQNLRKKIINVDENI